MPFLDKICPFSRLVLARNALAADNLQQITNSRELGKDKHGQLKVDIP
jgi:hypothetical protein